MISIRLRDVLQGQEGEGARQHRTPSGEVDDGGHPGGGCAIRAWSRSRRRLAGCRGGRWHERTPNMATNTRTHCHVGTRTTTPACMSRRITNKATGAMKYANRVGFSAARGRRSSPRGRVGDGPGIARLVSSSNGAGVRHPRDLAFRAPLGVLSAECQGYLNHASPLAWPGGSVTADGAWAGTAWVPSPITLV